MMISGRDSYAEKYRHSVDEMSLWHRHGAASKADSVQMLCDNIGFLPESIVEIGAGTGAVISELRRRNFGKIHIAFDYSKEALEYLNRVSPEIRTIQGDLTQIRDKIRADIVVCSHVLEHLEDPVLALDNIRENVHAKYYIFEVPLEDLFFGRLRNKKYRKKNPAGHVQFLNARSFRRLIESRYAIENERIYFPKMSNEAFCFIINKSDTRGFKRVAKHLTQRVLPYLFGPLWTRFWHAHMAVIAS